MITCERYTCLGIFMGDINDNIPVYITNSFNVGLYDDHMFPNTYGNFDSNLGAFTEENFLLTSTWNFETI